MKKNIIIIFILIALITCDSSTKSSNKTGRFICNLFDSTDTKIVHGWIDIEITDSNEVDGIWKLEKLNNYTKISVGNGDLVGTQTGDTLLLQMHPNFRDNNLFIRCVLKNNKIEGEWYFSTLIGLTNYGTIKGYENIGD